MNAPERFNVWRWEDSSENDKRLVYSADTKSPNAGNFVLGKEDHTIGNLLRMYVSQFVFEKISQFRRRRQLLRDPAVRFAGYRIPHPLIFECHVKVQTMDPKVSPIKAFENALDDLCKEISVLEDEFKVRNFIIQYIY